MLLIHVYLNSLYCNAILIGLENFTEKFEDTKMIIMIGNSKDRQYNCQWKRDKKTNNYRQKS